MIPYPTIIITESEHRRENILKRIGAAVQAEMDRRGNPCALKGGTALRFTLGLPRPSTDLDFEGDHGVNIRKALTKALATAFPSDRYWIGHDPFWRGTVRVRIWDGRHAGWLDATVDYRRTGSRANMPAKVPLDRCERLHGMNIYAGPELVHRKLATMVGERPRRAARDIYDTGWIATEHPELIGPEDAEKLQSWLSNLGPPETDELKTRLQREEVTGRISTTAVWTALETAIRALQPAR